MKNTLILTINDNANYGNRLQNYALSELLKEQKPSTIRHYVNIHSFALRLLKIIYQSVKDIISVIFKSFSSSSILEIRRVNEGRIFTKKYVPDSDYEIYVGHPLRSYVYKTVSHVVIGSDQVWNYLWLSKDDLALRLGSFVPDDIPIISYAASFGVSDISDDVKPIFQKYLPRLKAISVRENRGRNLVKEMTGLESVVVLDPTLMLATEKWDTITRGFVSNDDQYVLTYFLGKPSDVQERVIQKYAETHDCRVRRILDLRDKETYVAGPQDFVELFSKAQYVFTDSYHACCFSILYHKQFTVFNRAGMEGKANMNSRMETLFRLFDLDSVVMDDGLAPDIDYEKVDKLLTQHRTESRLWLNNVMSED